MPKQLIYALTWLPRPEYRGIAGMFGTVVRGYAAGRRFADEVVVGTHVIRCTARTGRMAALPTGEHIPVPGWAFDNKPPSKSDVRFAKDFPCRTRTCEPQECARADTLDWTLRHKLDAVAASSPPRVHPLPSMLTVLRRRLSRSIITPPTHPRVLERIGK